MTRRALGWLVGSLVGVLALSGCGTTGGGPRLAVRGAEAIVRIQGEGSVQSPGKIACESKVAVDATTDRCRGSWDGMAAPSLVAQPAPGWRFSHWEWRELDASLAYAPTSRDGTAHVYTAVFVPEELHATAGNR